jgi:hypothetical protein
MPREVPRKYPLPSAPLIQTTLTIGLTSFARDSLKKSIDSSFIQEESLGIERADVPGKISYLDQSNYCASFNLNTFLKYFREWITNIYYFYC